MLFIKHTTIFHKKHKVFFCADKKIVVYFSIVIILCSFRQKVMLFAKECTILLLLQGGKT